jgi:hypothetical protein
MPSWLAVKIDPKIILVANVDVEWYQIKTQHFHIGNVKLGLQDNASSPSRENQFEIHQQFI